MSLLINKQLWNTCASLAAGALTVLAFSPYDYFLIPFFTLGLLFYQFRSSRTSMQAFSSGYLFGLGLFGAGVSWLYISINLFGGVSLAGAILITLALILFLSLYPAISGWIVFRYRKCQTSIMLMLVMPAAWTLMEWCRSWIFTGFPWLNIGYTQTDSPMSGMAPILGVYGVGWLTAMTAGLFCLVAIGRKREKILAAIALLCIWMFALQSQQSEWTTPGERSLTTAVIQGGIEQQVKWLPEQRQKSIDTYMKMTEPYWGHDLILWPETALPMFYHQAGEVIAEIRRLSRQHGSHLVSGIAFMDPDSGRYYNSLILFGEIDDMYHKRHLVPFGEYLPFDKYLRPILGFLDIPMSSFSRGEQGNPVLVVSGEVIGVSICYEDVFGEQIIDAMPQASMLANVSNDAWFGDSLAPHQHLQMARMRAMETGRYMIRSTNTGISAIIDQKGKILDQLPQFGAHALSARVVPFEGSTPYSKTGNLFIIGLMIAILGLCMSRHKHNADEKPAEQ